MIQQNETGFTALQDNINDNGFCAAATEANPRSKNIQLIINGCEVKLNIPLYSDKNTIDDIKRMILYGSVKS